MEMVSDDNSNEFMSFQAILCHFGAIKSHFRAQTQNCRRLVLWHLKTIWIWLYFHVYILQGIGGTCKRCCAKESLTRTVDNQIITPLDVFNFCDERLNNIKALWVSKEEIAALWEEKLEARYANAKTVTGTLGFHYIEPIPGTTNVWVKEISSDVEKFEKETSR